MDNIIDVSIPVAEVVDKHPEVLDILVELGFKPLANPLMRNTVGRKVSLKQGSKLEGTPMDKSGFWDIIEQKYGNEFIACIKTVSAFTVAF